jgi:hypothetical protein
VLTLLSKGIKIFLIEDISHLPPVLLKPDPWSTLSCEYLREFFEKIRNGPYFMLWGWGETE